MPHLLCEKVQKEGGLFEKNKHLGCNFQKCRVYYVPMGRRRCFESVIRLPIFYFIDPKEWHPL